MSVAWLGAFTSRLVMKTSVSHRSAEIAVMNEFRFFSSFANPAPLCETSSNRIARSSPNNALSGLWRFPAERHLSLNLEIGLKSRAGLDLARCGIVSRIEFEPFQ